MLLFFNSSTKFYNCSIGSLGKYQGEKDVSGVTVSNCTLRSTTNGVRIKTYTGSPPSKASSITFKDIIMDMVKNPIIIDQKYGSRSSAVIHLNFLLFLLTHLLAQLNCLSRNLICTRLCFA